MYETDRLPEDWVDRINKMDEVWVPSKFSVKQFVDSGVDAKKVVMIPEPVDADLFNPANHTPLSHTGLEDAKAGGLFRFLSVFKWEPRKGWDVLLTAYFSEFSGNDPVVLTIKTQSFHSDGDFNSQVAAFVESMGSAAKKPLARFELIAEDLDASHLPGLYAVADAFVLPSRGEGWGRPHVEAMAMALPVIATNWGGSMEFMSEKYSLPLRIDGLEPVGKHGPKGHQWAVPSLEDLRAKMRWVAEHREEAKALGQKARAVMVSDYSPKVIVEKYILPRLVDIAHSLDLKNPGAPISKEEVAVATGSKRPHYLARGTIEAEIPGKQHTSVKIVCFVALVGIAAIAFRSRRGKTHQPEHVL